MSDVSSVELGECIDNDQVQHDEIVALQSIFGDTVVSCMPSIDTARNIRVVFPERGATPALDIRVVFPQTYPRSSPPVVEIESMVLDASMVQMMIYTLEETMFTPGEVVCFEWLTWVRQQFEDACAGHGRGQHDVDTLCASISYLGYENDALHGTSSVGRHVCDSQDNNGCDCTARQTTVGPCAGVPGGKEQKGNVQFPSEQKQDCKPPGINHVIFHGEVLEQKKSKFQAHVARVTSMNDVAEVMENLLGNNKVQHATHNIMAYRFTRDNSCGVKTVFQDCDDDGEAAAGKRLLHLLQVMDVQNRIVVVSRWYGGVHLGPARFQCINNAARLAIESSVDHIETFDRDREHVGATGTTKKKKNKGG